MWRIARSVSMWITVIYPPLKKLAEILKNIIFKTFRKMFFKDSHFGACKLGCVLKVPICEMAVLYYKPLLLNIYMLVVTCSGKFQQTMLRKRLGNCIAAGES